MFAEDEIIPFTLVARLWRATAGLDDLRAAQVCARLAQLALVSRAAAGPGGVALHDVVRDFLRAELGQQRLAELNGILLDAVAAGLPAASPLAADRRGSRRWPGGNWAAMTGTCGITSSSTCWMQAGPLKLRSVACDLRWVGARLKRFGPAAPAADLSLVGHTAGGPAARRAGTYGAPAGADRSGQGGGGYPAQPGRRRPGLGTASHRPA